ncbi:major royal jelly protein 5-like isoform X2 [Zerene cesonia]|nr:major royal jelly protein 5-like isoform X2 [Zerene cesonia]
MNCEHGADLWMKSKSYVKDNIIAIKAVKYKDEIFVSTPRLKPGVLAGVWLLIQANKGVELQPFPELRSHHIADCRAVQNVIDMYLDNFGNLWILDSGIIETLVSPRCTCPPKIVSISLPLKKLTKHIDLSHLTEPTSQLQNIVVEYTIAGKPFMYVSDASRGAIIVYDVTKEAGWHVTACSSSPGLQLALVKRGLAQSVLVLISLNWPGILELDTGILKRKNAQSALRMFGEHTKPVVLLGFDAHHVYLRHTECTDVLSWDTRHMYNSSHLTDIHSAGPRLVPTSVTADYKRNLLILDSNYGDAVQSNVPAYHRITITSQP